MGVRRQNPKLGEDDPLIDWLELYGQSNGFIPDTRLDGYLSHCDFRKHIFRNGKEFEIAVIKRLQDLIPFEQVANGRDDSGDIEKAKLTFNRMVEGQNSSTSLFSGMPKTRPTGCQISLSGLTLLTPSFWNLY